MPDTPLHGDVLITAEDGRYLLSVVPNPHRLSLSEFSTALQIARRMADANNASVWRASNGVLTRVPFD